MPKSAKSTRASQMIQRKTAASIFTPIEEAKAEDVVAEFIAELELHVLDSCEAVYLEKQVIKYTIHCAQHAFLKLLRLHSYKHIDYPRDTATWTPDTPPLPSRPDSWAAYSVPTCKRRKTPSPFSSISQLGIDMEDRASIMVPVDYADDDTDEYRDDQIRAVLDALLDRIVEEASEPTIEKESSSTALSCFQAIATTDTSYRPFLVKTSWDKISRLQSARLPKVDIPVYKGLAEECIPVDDLIPPFRVNADCARRQRSAEDTRDKGKE